MHGHRREMEGIIQFLSLYVIVMYLGRGTGDGAHKPSWCHLGVTHYKRTSYALFASHIPTWRLVQIQEDPTDISKLFLRGLASS